MPSTYNQCYIIKNVEPWKNYTFSWHQEGAPSISKAITYGEKVARDTHLATGSKTRVRRRTCPREHRPGSTLVQRQNHQVARRHGERAPMSALDKPAHRVGTGGSDVTAISLRDVTEHEPGARGWLLMV